MELWTLSLPAAWTNRPPPGCMNAPRRSAADTPNKLRVSGVSRWSNSLCGSGVMSKRISIPRRADGCRHCGDPALSFVTALFFHLHVPHCHGNRSPLLPPPHHTHTSTLCLSVRTTALKLLNVCSGEPVKRRSTDDVR